LTQEGWKRYIPKNKVVAEKEDEDKEDENLILELSYKKGDKVNVEKKNLKEIESKPPAIYTPATLIADLSNLAKFLQEQSPEIYDELQGQIDLKGLEIGTKGTRPNIIEQLVNSRKFIAFEKNKYVPTPLGLQFYETVKDLEVVNVAQTARLEYQLKQVQDGALHAGVFHNNLLEYVKNIVQSIFSLESKIQKQERTSLGTCPKCKKGSVFEGKKSFSCSEYKNGCNFTIWKTIAGKTITQKQVQELLTKGKTSNLKGFKSKAGKSFEAKLKLENFEIKFEFAEKKNN
ncbi:topoisomerase C-terminal repeat-containing protein, partial [Capnocytophaga stomatis]|uniref:topoisomerase C-terminal repeat-containing protein n=1 Tax=Capnocytophaga stomatis TaxID=1848904 RepID=UPI00194E6F7E